MTDTLRDYSQRFLFEEADIRGEKVLLDDAYGDILAIHQYAPGVARLMGEFLAAAVLLSNNLKFEGRLTLQARSDGQLPLLMAESNHQLHIRGIARGSEQATASSNEELLSNGQLAITVEPLKGQRYQGIVALQEGSVAHNLDAYFRQSEQLGSRIWLAADGQRAGGMLLQQLPSQRVPEPGQRINQWEHVLTLTDTLRDEEILTLDSTTLLGRLYREDPVRLFDAHEVRFQCSCSRERTYSALSTLNPAELNEMLQEMGRITMDCEFCNTQYHFERADLTSVLGLDETKTLH